MARQADPSERRRQIVEAAYVILSSQGLSALSMRTVAKAAGVTTGMVTHWFATRGLLLLAAVEMAIEREERRVKGLVKAGTGLNEILAAFLPIDPERAAEIRVWIGFWAASISDEALADAHRNRYQIWTNQLVLVGLVPNMQAAARLIAAVDGISIDAVLDPERWPSDAQLGALKAFAAALCR